MTAEMEKTISGLVQRVEQRYYGKYRGFVVDNADPEKLGRLKVTVPGVLGKDISVWAYPCVPYGGNANRGFLFIPENKAGVWVEFEEGDTEFPIWVGTFWSQPGGTSEVPKPVSKEGKEEGAPQNPPTAKMLKSTCGHTILMEDKEGGEMITIMEASQGHIITLNDEGITIKDKKNSNEVVMDSEGVTIKTNGSILLGDGADQFLVQGNKLQEKITELTTKLQTHTHPVPSLGESQVSGGLAGLTLIVPLSSKHKVK